MLNILTKVKIYLQNIDLLATDSGGVTTLVDSRSSSEVRLKNKEPMALFLSVFKINSHLGLAIKTDCQ